MSYDAVYRPKENLELPIVDVLSVEADGESAGKGKGPCSYLVWLFTRMPRMHVCACVCMFMYDYVLHLYVHADSCVFMCVFVYMQCVYVFVFGY